MIIIFIVIGVKMIESLRRKIGERTIKIGVIGLGYVGLPFAVSFAEQGVKVIGFDVVEEKVSILNSGKSYIPDIPNQKLKKVVDQKHFSATTDFSKLSEVDLISICVPTPLRKTKDPDISFIVAARDEIFKYIRKGHVIVLESTTYPGTTEELLIPEIMEKGYKIGTDVFVAFSPERIDPGNEKYTIVNTPKVVGGYSENCTSIVKEIYSLAMDTVVTVGSPATAEMVKLLENTYRAVNIGLVNEIAIICQKLEINTWEVIEAAATKPYGFMPFFPGPGLGGHCIPIDPHYLSWKMRTLNYDAKFIELASQINGEMPEYCFRLLIKGLNGISKSVNKSKILIMGVAYKKDIDDIRESPALDFIKLIEDYGGEVYFYDPFVKTFNVGKCEYISINFNEDFDKIDFDAAVIITAHSEVDYSKLMDLPLILDTRNVIKDNFENVVRL